MAMVFLVSFLLLIAELIWQIIIKYPPTLEQLHMGVNSPFALWGVRLFSLALITASTFFFSSATSIKTKKYYWILVLSSPVLSLVWMSYPLDAIKLFLISGMFYLLVRRQKSYFAATAISVAVLLILNLGVFKQNPKILDTLSLTRSQEEVTRRFTAEDIVNPHIEIPTVIRRIGYNKYFISLKNFTDEALTFLDFETIFFQEVHPMDQKAFVIFFWPEIFIFCISLWLVLDKRDLNQKVFFPLLFLAFIYFMTTSASADRRLVMIIFPLSILMSTGIKEILKNRDKKLKVSLTILIDLSFYGWMTNYYDRYVRPDFWLDNHPIAYNFVLSYLKNESLQYKQVQVPDTLYAVKDYCPYYFKNCSQFRYEDIDLSKNFFDKDIVYVGYTGNFLGQNNKDAPIGEIEQTLRNKGLEILQTMHILNNIANGYGQELLIVQSKK